jgi:hypothetical protein
VVRTVPVLRLAMKLANVTVASCPKHAQLFGHENDAGPRDQLSGNPGWLKAGQWAGLKPRR